MTAVTCVLRASVIHSLLKKVFRNLCLKLLSDTFTVKESLQLYSEIAANYEKTGGRQWRTMTNNCNHKELLARKLFEAAKICVQIMRFTCYLNTLSN